MLDRPVVAFDIETMPDPAIGRSALGIEGSDRDVVLEMVRRRHEETKGATVYPALPWHQVVTICVSIFDPTTNAVTVRCLGERGDERSQLEAFFELVTKELRYPRLVSWNGAGFDLPVIRYRSMRHGIAAPQFYEPPGDRFRSNYENRYHDLHVDLMDVLSGFGASPRASLSAVATGIGLPGKAFLSGEVYEHILDDQWDRVVEYCKLDTLDTLLVFLGWGVHRGWLERERLQIITSSVRETIAREPYPGWRDIGAALAEWPMAKG